jgi:O-antigen ligase
VPEVPLASPVQLASASPAPQPLPGRARASAPPAWLGTAFLVLIVLAPLPLGSNRPAFWSLLGLAAALLCAGYLLLLRRGAVTPGFRLGQLAAMVLPFAAAVVWAAFQAAPLGAAANPLWGLAGDALGLKLAGAVSLDPHETLSFVLRLITYGLVFWLALELGRHRAFADRALRWLAYAGLVYAAYGLVMHVLGIERILWIPKTAYQGFVTGTFVNRNSYATYAALGFLCAIGLTLDALRAHGARPRKGRLAFAALIERLSGRALLPLIAAVTLAVALAQTGSRAAIASLALGLVVFALAAASARLVRFRTALIGIALIAAILGTAIALRGGAFVDRLDSGTLDKDRDARAEIYALTADALKDNPLIGTGLGTFPQVFALYRGASFDTLGPIDKAHNSYLGNALELGIPAALLFLAALAAAGQASLAGLKRRRRGRLFPVLGLSALTVVALHSTVDFSLEIPAVSVTFAALMGVACAQSHRSRTRRRRKPVLRVVSATA